MSKRKYEKAPGTQATAPMRGRGERKRQKKAKAGTSPKGYQTKVSWVPLASRLFKAIATPVALSCDMLLHAGEYEQLARKTVDSRDYLDPLQFFLDSQAVSFLKKLDCLPVDTDPREAALETFRDGEDRCAKTNARFFSELRLQYKEEGGAHEVLHLAGKKIARVLGDVPTYDDLTFRFGPGASYGVRRETAPFNKLCPNPDASSNMSSNLGYLCKQFPSWLSVDASQCTLVQGSRLGFASKNALTHRTTGSEPTLNGLVQKAIGKHIRKRLLRIGINLTEQWEVNQKLASQAHLQEFATVDLRNASDTIAYASVLELLPIDWVELLDHCRSPEYLLDGEWKPFHKFSSMGNGYTFELETLIFYALATAACEVTGEYHEVGFNLTVYGDDIIIPKGAFVLLQRTLSYLGFEVNEAKTFVEGRFFESCGMDYFDGLYVRPVFLRQDIKDVGIAFCVTNQIQRIAKTCNDLSPGRVGRKRHLDGVLERLSSLHQWLVSGIPKRLRLLGPATSGRHLHPFEEEGNGGKDAYLEVGLDLAVANSATVRSRGWDGWFYTALATQPVQKPYPNKVSVRDRANASYWADQSIGDQLYRWSYLSPWSPPRERQHQRASFLAMIKGLPRVIHDTSVMRGYEVRGRTRVVSTTCFHFGPWPDCPYPWTDGAISLLHSTGKPKIPD